MQTLVFSHTSDLPHIDQARAVQDAAAKVGYSLDLRHAHAVVEAWRTARGKTFITDDGAELSVPPMPLEGQACVAFLLSFCHTPKPADAAPRPRADVAVDVEAWWAWVVANHTADLSPFADLIQRSVAARTDTPKAWSGILHLIENPPARKPFELMIRAILSPPTAAALADILWPQA